MWLKINKFYFCCYNYYFFFHRFQIKLVCCWIFLFFYFYFYFFLRAKILLRWSFSNLFQLDLKKYLGSRCSNFYFKGVKTKKKFKKLYIIFFSSLRDLNEAAYNESGTTSSCENVVIFYCLLRLSSTYYIDPSLFVDHFHLYKLVNCENGYVRNIFESFEL